MIRTSRQPDSAVALAGAMTSGVVQQSVDDCGTEDFVAVAEHRLPQMGTAAPQLRVRIPSAVPLSFPKPLARPLSRGLQLAGMRADAAAATLAM
jgi:hypothetical protein